MGRPWGGVSAPLTLYFWDSATRLRRQSACGGRPGTKSVDCERKSSSESDSAAGGYCKASANNFFSKSDVVFEGWMRLL